MLFQLESLFRAFYVKIPLIAFNKPVLGLAYSRDIEDNEISLVDVFTSTSS